MKTTLEVLQFALAKARNDFYVDDEIEADIEAAIEREKRGWVGRLEEEIDAIDGQLQGEKVSELYQKLAEVVEAKLKEKNNG